MVSPKGSKDETRGGVLDDDGQAGRAEREGVPKGRGPRTLWGVWGQLATERLTDLPPGQVCWRDSYLDVDVLAARHCIWVGWFVDGKKMGDCGRSGRWGSSETGWRGRQVSDGEESLKDWTVDGWTALGPPRDAPTHPSAIRHPQRYATELVHTLQPAPAQRAMSKLWAATAYTAFVGPWSRPRIIYSTVVGPLGRFPGWTDTWNAIIYLGIGQVAVVDSPVDHERAMHDHLVA